MKKSLIVTIGIVLAAVLLVSCAGVKFEYSHPNYLEMQLNQLPDELLGSRIVLNDDGQTLLGSSLTVAEFLVLLMAAEPIERNTWLTANVVPGDEGSTITIKQYVRGNLTLMNTINLSYQNGFAESRVVSIVWDDKRFGEKLELVSIEDKAAYAALIFTYFIIQ